MSQYLDTMHPSTPIHVLSCIARDTTTKGLMNAHTKDRIRGRVSSRPRIRTRACADGPLDVSVP